MALGPFFLPKPGTTLTKRRLYCMRRLARPVFFFFFSCFATCGDRAGAERGGPQTPGGAPCPHEEPPPEWGKRPQRSP